MLSCKLSPTFKSKGVSVRYTGIRKMTFSASSASASDDSLALSMDEERETTPAEDRERIIHLGIAITWIHQEMENLKENYSLTLINRELDRVRSIVEEIRDANLTEEKKRMDYSFYDSPGPSFATEEEEDIKDKQLYDEWFGSVTADEEESPSIATGKDDKQLFQEWFGCLTEEKKMKHTITEHHPSLHVPTYDARRSYSQTLV